MMGRPRVMASAMVPGPALVTMQSTAPIHSSMFATKPFAKGTHANVVRQRGKPNGDRGRSVNVCLLPMNVVQIRSAAVSVREKHSSQWKKNQHCLSTVLHRDCHNGWIFSYQNVRTATPTLSIFLGHFPGNNLGRVLNRHNILSETLRF